MDRDTIIDGLRMTMALCVFDPSTGEEIEPHLLNDINRATYDACKGALEILERLGADSDTISRQAALVAVKDALMAWSYMPEWRDEKILEAIAELPPAQPEPSQVVKDIARIVGNEQDMTVIGQERIRGRWIEKPHVHGVAYCSLCDYELHTNDTNFCPNCGAEMEETE